MGFDASSYDVREHLDSYDFRPVVEAHGLIPMPTQGRLDDFVNAVGNLAGQTVTIDTLDQILPSVPDVGLAGLIADLCAGSPSRDELRALPSEVFQHFVGWLTGKLADPTLPTSAPAETAGKSST